MCSRVTYLGPAGSVITGRTMDWMLPLHTNLWLLPAGLQRDGAARLNSLTWTSKFGSLAAVAYDGATADGVNEAGLVANLLYLAEANYGPRDGSTPGLSVAGWAQFVLDSFATVAEAVNALDQNPFQLVPMAVPGGFAPTLHLAISDASGDSAILEYLGDGLVIHHGRQFQVMTNSPTFDKQLALREYWDELDGAMLPGTERAADRFVRASYYLDRLVPTDDEGEGPAAVFSVIRNVSVPLMVEPHPDEPNIAPTLWRSVADATRLRYFFEDTRSPNIFWVDLAACDLRVGAHPARLVGEGGPIRAGEVSGSFEPTALFEFMPEA